MVLPACIPQRAPRPDGSPAPVRGGHRHLFAHLIHYKGTCPPIFSRCCTYSRLRLAQDSARQPRMITTNHQVQISVWCLYCICAQAKLAASKGRCLAFFYYAGYLVFSLAELGHLLQPSDFRHEGDGIALEAEVLEPMMSLAHHAVAIVDVCRGSRGSDMLPPMRRTSSAAMTNCCCCCCFAANPGTILAMLTSMLQLYQHVASKSSKYSKRKTPAPLMVGWAAYGPPTEPSMSAVSSSFTTELLEVWGARY